MRKLADPGVRFLKLVQNLFPVLRERDERTRNDQVPEWRPPPN
jgi:hypothetical protein